MSQVDSQENPMHHFAYGTFVALLAVSSFVLVKRVEKCAPVEADSDKTQRQTIMVSSALVIVAAFIKTLTASFGRFKQYHKFSEGIFFLLALILSIVNIAYITNANFDSCTANANPMDAMASKDLSVFVLILSVIVLMCLVKKALWHAGTYKKKSPARY